jgi:hypothetical protein
VTVAFSTSMGRRPSRVFSILGANLLTFNALLEIACRCRLGHHQHRSDQRLLHIWFQRDWTLARTEVALVDRLMNEVRAVRSSSFANM